MVYSSKLSYLIRKIDLMNKDIVYYTLRDLDEMSRAYILMVLEGYRNTEIAKKYNVSEIAVEARLRKIYSRFNVRNRMGLVLLFIDDNILKILKSPVFRKENY